MMRMVNLGGACDQLVSSARYIARVVLVSLAGACATLSAAENDYLKMLSEEAAKGGAVVDKSTAKPLGENQGSLGAADVTDAMPESMVEFEQTLADSHQSTHNLYLKLDSEKRAEVYQEFQQSGDWSAVTRKVLSLLYNI